VPLLFEKGGWGELMDEIIVVDCPVEQQVQRVIERNGWPETQVRAVIQNQATRETRLEGATQLIQNNGDLAELIEKIDFMHQKLIKKRKNDLAICMKTTGAPQSHLMFLLIAMAR